MAGFLTFLRGHVPFCEYENIYGFSVVKILYSLLLFCMFLKEVHESLTMAPVLSNTLSGVSKCKKTLLLSVLTDHLLGT